MKELYRVPQCLEIFFLAMLLLPLSLHATDWQRTNIGGGGGMNTVAGGFNGTIVIGTDLGGANLKRATDTTWRIIGASSGMEDTHITNVAFHPSDANILFLSTDGALYRSINAGDNFTRVDAVNGAFVGGVFQDVAVAPSNPNIVYASRTPRYNNVANSDGTIPPPLLRSVDGGATFNYLNPPQGSNGISLSAQIIGAKVLVHPQNPDIVVMLSLDTRFVENVDEGVFVSTDGGQSWHHLAKTKADLTDMEFHPTAPYYLFLAHKPSAHQAKVEFTDLTSTNNLSNDRWYYVFDSKYAYPLPGEPGHDDRVQPKLTLWPNAAVVNELRVFDVHTSYYRLTDHQAAFRVYRNASGWTFSGLGNVKEWSGGVNNWQLGWSKLHTILGPSIMSTAHTLGLDASNPNRAYWATIQSVFQIIDNNDGSLTISNLSTSGDEVNGWQSTGIDNITPFILDINQADPNVIYAGLNDLGCTVSQNNGLSWNLCIHDHNAWPGVDGHSYGGVVTALASDPGNPGKLWMFAADDQNDPVTPFLSTDFGQSWTPQSTDNLTATDESYGMSVDPTSPINNRRLFITNNGTVFRSTNDGAVWSSLSNDCNLGCRVTAVDANNGYVYAGGESGLFVSKSQGDSGSWHRVLSENAIGGFRTSTVFARGRWAGISALRADPSNPGVVFAVVFQDDTSQGIYRCDVSGVVTVDSNCTLVLDNIAYLRDIAVHPVNSNILYATASSAYTAGGYDQQQSGGVFRSINGGTTWQQINQGLEWPMAIPIQINPQNPNLVYLGAPGGGNYKADFSNGSSSIEVRVSQSSDDAEQRLNTGVVQTTSSDLELTREASTQVVGIRFQNVNVPAGATISAAYLEFTTDEIDSEPTSISIAGQAANNPATFSSANNDISTRALTNATIDWNNIPAWNTVGQTHQSPDLSTVIQEIIEINGWAAGNPMAFVINGSGQRTAESYNGTQASAPLLHIEFSSATQSIDIRVAQSTDDSEEQLNNGSQDLTSSDLELTRESSDQAVGIRFQGVNVPAGATIVSAYIEFTTDETDSEPTSINIAGQAAGDSATFSSSNSDISARPLTTAAVDWNTIPVWNTVGQTHQTPNLATVIQEIINLSGWSSGNAITFVITGSGQRTAESYNGSSSTAPLLHIEFNAGN